MSTSSLEFLGILLVGSALFPLLPGVRLRQIFLALISLGCLYTQVPNVPSWIALGLFLLSGYAAGHLLRRRGQAWILWTYLALLVASFLVLKKYSFLENVLPLSVWRHPIGIIGLSYILFRQIHVMVDCMEGQVERLSLWDFFNYQLNVFTLSAGPIQRFQEFLESWNRLEPLPRSLHEVSLAWVRIFSGVIKSAGIGEVLLYGYGKAYGRVIEMGARDPSFLSVLPWFALLFYLYPLYVFTNFSGYCDIVIGGGSLMGLSLPENFNKPYLSRNIIDFWTRFHRTLGFWIRDYLFMPLQKTLAGWSPAKAQQLAFLSYFVAFIFAGVWHGSTSNFAVYGFIHGVGASAAKLWETRLVKTRGRAGLKKYLAVRWIRLAGTVATLHYYAFAILFFSGNSMEKCLAPIRVLLRSLGVMPS